MKKFGTHYAQHTHTKIVTCINTTFQLETHCLFDFHKLGSSSSCRFFTAGRGSDLGNHSCNVGDHSVHFPGHDGSSLGAPRGAKRLRCAHPVGLNCTPLLLCLRLLLLFTFSYVSGGRGGGGEGGGGGEQNSITNYYG